MVESSTTDSSKTFSQVITDILYFLFQAKGLVPTEPYTIDIDTYYTELSLMYPQESYISVANSTTKSFTKVSGQEHFGVRTCFTILYIDILT